MVGSGKAEEDEEEEEDDMNGRRSKVRLQGWRREVGGGTYGGG